jgi:hypothetical protein
MADTTSLHLRLPKKLYKRLQRYAKSNNVSLNTQIINQLEANEAAFKRGVNDGAEAAALGLILKFTAGLFGPDQQAPLTPEENARWCQRVRTALRAIIDEAPTKERSAHIGAPVKRWEVFPLKNPPMETQEPKVPLPEKNTEGAESETVKSEGAEKK